MIPLHLIAPDQRTADLVLNLALALGCTEPPKKGQCVIDPTGAVFLAPAIPLDPKAEARVDEWCRENEPKRTGRKL